MTNYIRVPFAESGDKAEVPVATASDGSVSFVQGYPIAYSLDPETDTAAKRIERTKMNFLFNQITAAIQGIQENGVSTFITSDDNGGSAFPYAAGAVALYQGVVYQSLVDNNTALPTVTANWSPVSNQVNSVAIIPGAFAGDVNSITQQGLYSLTAAATNTPLGQTALLEHFDRSGSAKVQVWHSCSTTAGVANRHYIRVGTVAAGVTTWSPWTQTTLRPIELSSSQDLNSLVESGVYHGSSSVWSTNAPVSTAAFVEVTSNGATTAVKQYFHALTTNTVYQRTYNGAAWSVWRQVVTPDALPPYAVGLAGEFRRLKISITGPSSNTNVTVDEVIAGTALGGSQYRIASVNKTIDLSKTGLGGMNTGSPPSNGFVAIYIVLNPTTGDYGLVAINSTSSVAPTCFGSISQLPDYTASALLSVWRTNSSGQLVAGHQLDRKVAVPRVDVLINNGNNPGGWTAIGLASVVPQNAVAASGYAFCNSGSGVGAATLIIGSDNIGSGFFQVYAGTTGALGTDIYFESLLPIVQNIFYQFSWTTSGPSTATVGISGYTI